MQTRLHVAVFACANGWCSLREGGGCCCASCAWHFDARVSPLAIRRCRRCWTRSTAGRGTSLTLPATTGFRAFESVPPFTAFYCLLLPSTAFYCLLLPFTAFRYLSLPFTAFHYLPLPNHYFSLPFTAFSLPLFWPFTDGAQVRPGPQIIMLRLGVLYISRCTTAWCVAQAGALKLTLRFRMAQITLTCTPTASSTQSSWCASDNELLTSVVGA